jgi:hypothetical protein
VDVPKEVLSLGDLTTKAAFSHILGDEASQLYCPIVRKKLKDGVLSCLEYRYANKGILSYFYTLEDFLTKNVDACMKLAKRNKEFKKPSFKKDITLIYAACTYDVSNLGGTCFVGSRDQDHEELAYLLNMLGYASYGQVSFTKNIRY